MKKALIVLAVLVFSVSLVAQQRTGNIYGKITDAERNPLPGVTVTLTGPAMAPLTTVTNEVGNYRFPSIPPGIAYEIKAELQGFKTSTQGAIVVNVGSNAEINLVLEVGKLEEQVTVTAATPIVDTKKTATAMNVGKEELQSLPTARDPWVVMQLAPSIMLDRENVGGNESGQQASFLAKGDMSNNGYVGSDNIWAIDGIDITDPAALGGSALYYDFDMFEELNITTGGAADVTVQTGGIALNMVTRRGGNKMSLAGRFYLTDNFFQSNNLTQSLKDQGVAAVNKIQQIKDYGFNAGGPIIKDKLWWWGAYGVQDIFVFTMYSTQDKTLLNNYNLKMNAQVFANNRFEALVTSGAKEKFGRNAAVAKPEGDHQQGKYHWGSPIIKLQDEHVFGNDFYVSLKYSFNDAGFGWKPMTDEGLNFPVVWSNANQKYVAYQSGMLASWGSYFASRPRNNYQLNASYFNDTLLGLSHEIKVGAEYSHKIAEHRWGNFQGFQVTRDYNAPTLDVNADGTRATSEMTGWQNVNFYRDGRDNGVADQYAAYIQDTISKGNFTVTLGLRFDQQKGSMGAITFGSVFAGSNAWDSVFATDVSTKLAGILPPISTHSVKGNSQIVNGAARPYQWNTWSPRIGITWDITGDGKTVAKLALSQYGDVMGTGAWASLPRGTGGSMNFYWLDANADKKVNFDEMYWIWSNRNPVADPANPGLPYRYVPYRVFDGSGNFTPEATAALTSPGGVWDSDSYYRGNIGGFNINDPLALDYNTGNTQYFLNRGVQSSTRTREFLVTLEREIFPDFAASANFTMRRYDNFDYNMTYYPAAHSDEYPLYTGPEVIDPRTPPAGGWFVEAGTVPSTVNIGGVDYSTGGASGRTYFNYGPDWPTTATSYALMRKANSYNTYTGVDLVLTKRLSNKWFANASFTWQDQRSYWGDDWFDPTNQWMSDGKPYGQWGGGASGKVSVLMYTRWMAKLSGLYQLPYGFDISGTVNAREGWKIPNGFWIENDASPNPAVSTWAWIYTQEVTKDSLPTFVNVTMRLEKKINIGAGRLYLMADVFNIFNSATVNRAYDAYFGDVYYATSDPASQYDSWVNPTNRRLNEILNPRIWRFGVRFEF